MAQHGRLSQLFEEGPYQWGLRGDPHLWNEMVEIIGDQPLPPTESEFIALIESQFAQLTGAPLSSKEPVYVKRYNQGGISGGYVNPQFWRDTALPLLRSRYQSFSAK
jgi:molybdenum cofactor cytidylyltransferase